MQAPAPRRAVVATDAPRNDPLEPTLAACAMRIRRRIPPPLTFTRRRRR
jgi:hypothetical protein